MPGRNQGTLSRLPPPQSQRTIDNVTVNPENARGQESPCLQRPTITNEPGACQGQGKCTVHRRAGKKASDPNRITVLWEAVTRLGLTSHSLVVRPSFHSYFTSSSEIVNHLKVDFSFVSAQPPAGVRTGAKSGEVGKPAHHALATGHLPWPATARLTLSDHARPCRGAERTGWVRAGQ